MFRRPPASPISIPSSSPPSIGKRRRPRRGRSSISTSNISNRADPRLPDSRHRIMMRNTKNVVDYIVSSRYESIPGQALTVAKGAIQDCVGVALAGARHPGGSIPAEWARNSAGAGSATVWGQNFKTSAHDAALVNGTAAHALDYDDVTWGLIGHPSVSLVPCVLAIGETINASGRDALHAYVVGFEVMAKLGRTTQPLHSLDGG